MTSSPLEDLLKVASRLRDKETGCPWDIEQDYKSIVPHTLEEAYEVADAIEREDFQNLREELGDLLFQVVFYAQMAKEDGLFTMDEIINDMTQKLIRRHPHVFGDTKATKASEVVDIWETEKEKEKRKEKTQQKGALDGVTKHLPALLRAQKLQKKASKVGFEWRDTQGFLDKCQEELEELSRAIAQKDSINIEEEFGDVLFCIVNLSRHFGVNAEESLRKANNKFINRFSAMECDIKNENKVISDLDVDEMLQYWVKAKNLS